MPPKAKAAKAAAKRPQPNISVEPPPGQLDAETQLEEDPPMPLGQLRNMHAHLAAMAVKGDAGPKEYYKTLATKAEKRSFLANWQADKRCKFVSEIVDRTSITVTDNVDVVEGWMSQPGS